VSEKYVDRFVSQFPGLVAFWDFQRDWTHPIAGSILSTDLPDAGVLQPWGTPPQRVDNGVFGDGALRFDGDGMLYVPRASMGPLAIEGPSARLSVVAWVRRREWRPRADTCEAIAGVWNEHGLRQYCLFLNLQIHNSGNQVAGHVCPTGGASPNNRYCLDAAIGSLIIPFDEWIMIAMTVGEMEVRSYLNGICDVRPGLNPYPYTSGIFPGGASGADFTVGAVQRPDVVHHDGREDGSIVGNFFFGVLGGLAVFDRSLTESEMIALMDVSIGRESENR